MEWPIIDSYGLQFHMFADDIQIYTVYRENSNTLSTLSSCLNDIKDWSRKNYLKLNDTKTKFMNIAPGLSKTSVLCFSPFNEVVEFEEKVKNLGFILDKKLSLKDQVSRVCQLGFYMLKNLWRISLKLENIPTKIQLVHSCVLCHIDYCNSLYICLPQKEIMRLQRLMNASVRFIYNLSKRDYDISITEYLKKCHFLPVKLRINFKICAMVYNCLQGNAPEYMTDMLRYKSSLECLRIRNDSTLLDMPCLAKLNYKNSKFSIAAPTLWNKLPMTIRTSPTLTIFKKKLKTYYFDQF